MRHWGKEFGCCHAGELQLSIKAWRQRLSNRMSWNTGQVISRQLPLQYLLGKEAINSLDAFNLKRNLGGERKSSNLKILGTWIIITGNAIFYREKGKR